MLKLQWSDTSLAFLHEVIPEELTPVASIHNGQNDWKQMLILFSATTKQFHWITGYGCSCCEDIYGHLKNSPLLVSGNARELKRALRGFLNMNPNIITKDEKEKVSAKINKCK